MSGRSGAISHTTLHEATKGNRLPSWETTVEFVKACNADPAAYREEWERANLAVRSVSAGDAAIRADALVEHPSGGLVTAATGVTELRTVHLAIADDLQPLLPARRNSGRLRLIRPVVFATAAVAVGAAVFIVATINRASAPDQASLTPSSSSPSIALASDGCPVRSTNPPPALPLYKGDAAVFIADVTLPDCTPVSPGKTVTKIWRLKNAGTVPWKGYSLRRLDRKQQADHCQTIPDVPIKDTQPGEMVDIRTDITTPRQPGLCYVGFKMVDAAGMVVFPGSRPVNFQIIVDAR